MKKEIPGRQRGVERPLSQFYAEELRRAGIAAAPEEHRRNQDTHR